MALVVLAVPPPGRLGIARLHTAVDQTCFRPAMASVLSKHPVTPRFLDSIGMNNTKILAKLESRQSLLNFQVGARGGGGEGVGSREVQMSEQHTGGVGSLRSLCLSEVKLHRERVAGRVVA